MAQIINVGGKLLLAGMHWLDPESVRPNRPSKAPYLSKLVKPKTGTTRAITESVLVATTKAAVAAGTTRNAWGYLGAPEKRAMRKVPRFTKVYSAAEMFSAMPDLAVCSILIAQVPGEQAFVMCTSINGHPAPGEFDVVVPASLVEQTLSSWDGQLRAVTTSVPTLYGTWTGVKHSLTLEKLTLTAAAVRPVRAVGTDMRQVAALAAVIGGSAFGYKAWEDYQRAQAAKNAQALAQQQTPAVVYQKALDEQWSSQPWGSLERVRALQQQVRTVREYVGGFKISTPVTCEVLNGVCTFSYKKSDESPVTFRDFKEDIQGQFVVTSFGQDGKTVVVSMTATGLPDGTPPAVDGLGAEIDTPLLFWEPIQLLSPTKKVSGSFMGDYKTFPQGLAINEAAVPALVRSVGITVTYPLWDLTTIPSSKGTYARAVSWKTLISENGAVTLAGEMYAKTNP